jgi:YfiH family protein
MITDKANLYLVVNAADCIPILMFEPNKRITAAVHTGWRGTEKEILSQTLDRIEKDFGVKSKDLFVYFGPSICKNCYEVDYDVSQKFPSEFVTSNEKKYLIDLVGINSMVLKQRGIQDNRIQISALCTFEMKNLLHSYRRDKNKSGRMFAVIGMKKQN